MTHHTQPWPLQQGTPARCAATVHHLKKQRKKPCYRLEKMKFTASSSHLLLESQQLPATCKMQHCCEFFLYTKRGCSLDGPAKGTWALENACYRILISLAMVLLINLTINWYSEYPCSSSDESSYRSARYSDHFFSDCKPSRAKAVSLSVFDRAQHNGAPNMIWAFGCCCHIDVK